MGELATIPVCKPEVCLEVGQTPPAITAREFPKPIGNTGADAVCWHERTAFLGGHFDRQVFKSCLNRGRRRVWAQGRKWSGVTVMGSWIRPWMWRFTRATSFTCSLAGML